MCLYVQHCILYREAEIEEGMEGNKWEKSNINFNQNTLNLNFRSKFKFRRGRINCSLNDDGKWRWFGIQFSVKQN